MNNAVRGGRPEVLRTGEVVLSTYIGFIYYTAVIHKQMVSKSFLLKSSIAKMVLTFSLLALSTVTVIFGEEIEIFLVIPDSISG